MPIIFPCWILWHHTNMQSRIPSASRPIHISPRPINYSRPLIFLSISPAIATLTPTKKRRGRSPKDWQLLFIKTERNFISHFPISEEIHILQYYIIVVVIWYVSFLTWYTYYGVMTSWKGSICRCGTSLARLPYYFPIVHIVPTRLSAYIHITNTICID